MASVGISSRDGQLGGGGSGATPEIYYCFECDRTWTIVATSDSGLFCPNCGNVVLEEFESPSSSPPPPPPRSITLFDPQSFFPTSDTDSDIELSDPLPPPPPLPFFITTSATSTDVSTILSGTINSLSDLHIHPQQPPPLSSENHRDFLCPFDSEVRHLRPPHPPPPPPPPPPLPSRSVIDRPPSCPQFPVRLAPNIDYFFLSPPEENDTTQYSQFDSELDALRPPPPPPPLPEHLLRSPPLSPSSSRDVWDSFYPLSTESESEDTHNEHMTSIIQSPPPPLPPRAASSWDNFFHPIPQLELDSPNHQRASQVQPPAPAPTPLEHTTSIFQSPPPPPPPPLEHMTSIIPPPPPPPPPLPPNSWDYFFPTIPQLELDSPSHQRASQVQPPPPPPPPLPHTTSIFQLPPPPAASSWDHFFPIPQVELDSPNHQRASQLQPPPPPPWLQPPPMEGLLDMKMTEKLVSEWECHQCAICIDNFGLNQMVKLMPCKHLYHSACILRWLDLHKSCPVCRRKLPSQ